MKRLIRWTMLLILLAAVGVSPFIYDRWQDRKHTLRADTDIQIVSARQNISIKAGTILRVCRIRYSKDDLFVDVLLPGGNSGRVVSGRFTIEPQPD